MDPWSVLTQIVLLLAAATLLGVIAQRLGQNAIIGYLLSGLLLGPHFLRMTPGGPMVQTLAEVGVALLLFTIGLEFSLSKLRALGSRVALLGLLQILVSAAVVALGAQAFGLDGRQAVLVGLAVALSSTSVVLRLISDRSELDSGHGRAALGVLLLQDVAVIPAMLLIPLLAGLQAGPEGLDALGASLAKALLLLSALYGLMRWVVPALMVRAASRQNRDLPVLLSAAVCLGASWASHALGLSAVLGAFAAGLILAECVLADQIRADIIPLRAAFLPLFFSSIGMLASVPGWQGLAGLAALALALLLVKTAVVTALAVALRFPLGVAVRTGMALAQIGEFSFVLLGAGYRAGLLEESVFRMLLAASVLTLLLSPALIEVSPAAAGAAESVLSRFRRVRAAAEQTRPERLRDHVVVIGFGPAGQQVVEELQLHGKPVLVIDLNPKTAAASSRLLPIEYGDASQQEILERAGVPLARAVVVTVPDPATARRIIPQVRLLNPRAPIIVRARYHIHGEALRDAGANLLVSEEVVVGRELATEALASLGRQR